MNHSTKIVDEKQIQEPGMAIEVLIAAAHLGFDKKVFRNMSDVAAINKSVNICNDFLKYERVKNANYGKLLVEFTDKEKNERILRQIPFKQEDVIEETKVNEHLTVSYLVVPEFDEEYKDNEPKYIMFYNGATLQLYPKQRICIVNNMYTVPCLPPMVMDAMNKEEENKEEQM